LILATDSAIIIGVIDMEKKHHVRTIPLGESPRRITYQGTSKVLLTRNIFVILYFGTFFFRHLA